MDKIDLVKETYSFEDFERSNDNLSENFMGTDSVGGPPFDKAGWIGMGQMFKNSFPDIKVVIEDIHEHGDTVSKTHNLETGPDAGFPGLIKVLGVQQA